jgi:hypothetical protein
MCMMIGRNILLSDDCFETGYYIFDNVDALLAGSDTATKRDDRSSKHQEGRLTIQIALLAFGLPFQLPCSAIYPCQIKSLQH